MKLGWGMVAGLGMAGLLVAAPAMGQTGSTGSSTGSSGSSSDTSKSGSSSTMGQPSGSSGSSTGSTTSGQSGTMGSSSERSASSMGMSGSQNQVTGKVQKLDKSKKELTLALPVSESTQVTKNGQTATLNDIKEGDQIRASFSGSGETLQVTSIEVLSKGATTPSTAPKSSTGGSSGMGSSGSSGSSTGSSGQSSTPGKGY